MDEKPHYNLLKNIREALDTLAFGGLERVEINGDNSVILRYPVGGIWILNNYIQFYLGKEAYQLNLDNKELRIIAYLFEVRNEELFIPTVQAWIDRRKNLEEKQDYTDKLRLIQNEVSYLYDKIEDIIKKEVKESL
jgi:hypothetical protein